jgi:hypothetical protein
MLLNKKQATDLAKAWRLGNKFRKKSLTKKHNLAPATSRNTGRVKMGIRMDIESKPREYYPAIDDDGNLVFFTGNPIKRIQVSDLFVPPKATKNRQRVPAKENTMINYKEKFLTTLFPNEDSIVLEQFTESIELDINNYSIFDIKQKFKAFKIQIDERTEFQLVAQKADGSELKSSWYKTENELADMQQKCEDSDEYESTSVMKRIVDVDEDEDNEEEFASVIPDEYLDGEEIEAGQNFSEEDEEVEEDKSKAYEELRTLYNLTNLALRQIPGSPKQRATIKKLNDVRKKLGMKPLKEMDIDINDEVNESTLRSFKTEYVEEENIEESKALDKLKFKGADKKNAEGVVSMIKKGDTPKEIAKMFKKLKTPSQEMIMTALGDSSSKNLLQKGKLLNQLISLFDEVEPKGLDGRSKEFRNKVRKLEYNKKKNKTFEVWESVEEDAADDAKKLNLIHLGHGIYGRKPGEPSHKSVDGKLTKMSDDEIAQHQDGDRDLDGKPGVKEPDAEKKPETPVPDSFDQINIDKSAAFRLGNYWKNVKPQKITVYADDEDEFIEADMEPDSPVERYYQHYLDALGIEHEEGDIERTDKNMAIFNKIGATDNAKIGELLSKITIDQGVAKKVLAKAKGASASEPKEPEGEEKPKSKSQELIGKIDDKSMSTGDARKAIYKAFGNDTYGPYGTFAGGVLDPSDNTSTFVDNDIGTPTFGKDVEIKMKNRARQSTVIKMLKTLGFDEYRDINRKKDRLEIDYDSKTFEKLGIAGRDNDKKRTEVMRALLNGDKKYYYKMLVRLAEIEGKFGLGKAKQESKKVQEKKVVKEKKLGALQKKSDKTGIPYGILKQVFNRGVAAWRTGHRPGTNPTQWGYARVNSFATKSKGTWGGADKDLAAKARGSMEKKKG